MHVKKSIILGVFIFLIPSLRLFAQLDNTGLEQPIVKDTTPETPFSFTLRALAFNKNNEYFNKIVEGYTLFGYRVTPAIGWQLHEQVKVEGGMFLQKDFGNNKLTYAIPYFSILYDWNDSQLLLGNINGSIHHRQIEPLEDFERLMYDVPESGIQYKFNRPKLFLDAWVNWERMIYNNSPFEEQLSGGLVSIYELYNMERKAFKLHYQFKGYHKAGQIDTITTDPLIIRYNNSFGMSFDEKWQHPFFHGYELEGHFLHFFDDSKAFELPYKQGYGYYLNGMIETKIGDFMLSYWYGDHFHSYKGGRIYQSFTTNNGSRRFEDVRQLLILRVMNEFNIGKSSTLLLRFEPYWDIENRQFEFSHAIYFNIFKTIPITK
ncbi:hypothetical protein JKA74_01105 [Marivirga sp. S37H4]|uniref:Uncharacterized protein n=1 Tax=Marivirga aurantiaca TaxID=2802615 RepID=A0A934WVG5_9BACT|nr:hypothetical protein [Marivirga aurantiaca]MBK6263615.1 hypothetical protein [Marivirga aurantiaca]